MWSVLKNHKVILTITVIVGSELVYYVYKKMRLKKHRPIEPVHEFLFFSDQLSNGCRKHLFEMNACSSTYCYYRNLMTMVKYLKSVNSSIDMCLYLLTSVDLANAVIDAHKRGIKVRIITDFEMAYSSGSKIALFKKQGIPVRIKKTDNLMHHKFCLLDCDTRNGILMTGSLNWTLQALAGNWDNLMFTSQPELVSQFKTEFERIWNSFIDLVDISDMQYA